MRFFCLFILLLIPRAVLGAPNDAFRKVHPILEHAVEPGDRARLEAETREILAMAEADLLAMVPAQTPFITSDCPACGNRHHARGIDAAMWKLEPPARIRCVQ